MNRDSIKVFIINQPFPYAEMEILGQNLREYARTALAEFSPIEIDCADSIKAPADSVIAVIYNDMPLITPEIILKLAEKATAIGIPQAFGKAIIYPAGKFNIKPGKPLDIPEALSVDGGKNLSAAYMILAARNVEKALEAGAVILDKTAIYIDAEAVIEPGAFIYPMVSVKGKSVIRSGAVLRSGTVIENSEICSGVNVLSSYIYDSKIMDNTAIGPCSLIRGGSLIGKNVRIGDFVEIKASKLGDECKAAHLTYIGDAEVGVNVNIGCGTVFCNYNGKIKQKTYVGDNSFIGSNTNLVAPVKVGSNAFTAAGSTVTEDVPDNTLCIARARQVIKERKDK